MRFRSFWGFALRAATPQAGSAPPPAKKTAGQIEKETNSSPQSSQRTLRKKILNTLCALRVLCGKILLENGI
jgi:hypothetical protein